jgi:hypothetical protein
MQACSLLLGRPWQYDNSVIHHGRTNSYTLVFKGKIINLLPMNPTEIVHSEKTKAPGNIDEDNVHALLAFNSPIHGFNLPSDERVPSGHDNLDCIPGINTINSDAQVNYKYPLVLQDTGVTSISKYGCMFGSALFSWLNNFQATKSRGRLCFQERGDDATIICVNMTKTIAHKYNCQVISICNPIIINCIIGNKKTIHVCVLCRIIGGINTSHTALPAFDKCLCMPKDVSIHSRMCDEAKSMHLVLLIKQRCSDSTKKHAGARGPRPFVDIDSTWAKKHRTGRIQACQSR